MKRRNLITYYDIYLHVLDGTPPSKIANLHDVSVQSIHKKIQWMVDEGILVKRRHEGLYKHTYYTPGPASAGFLKAVEELDKKIERKNSGAILGAPRPFASQPSTQPTLDFYSGKAPRVHRLHFVVRLKRPSSRPGLRFKVPHLPDTIKWTKEWEFRGGYKKLGEVQIAGWKDPATVQYFRSRKNNEESLYITLPALYILKEWMESYDDIKQYFYDIAKTIADEFRKSGYIIGAPEPVKRFGEMAFYLPVLSEVPKKKLRAQQIKEKVWIDFSHGFPEIETTDPEEADNISEAIQLFLELPVLKRKVEEHDKILSKITIFEQGSAPQPPGGMYQ